MTCADPRVAAHAQFLLRDDLPRDGARRDARAGYWGTYQSGPALRRRPRASRRTTPTACRSPRRARRSAGAPLRAVGLRARRGSTGDVRSTCSSQFAPSGADAFRDVGEPSSVLDPRRLLRGRRSCRAASRHVALPLEPSTGGREVASGVVGVRVVGVGSARRCTREDLAQRVHRDGRRRAARHRPVPPVVRARRTATRRSTAPAAGRLHRLGRRTPILRWLLLAAAVAPFILAWIIVREHELSWPRGRDDRGRRDRRVRPDLLQRHHRPAGRAVAARSSWSSAGTSRCSASLLMLVGSAMRAVARPSVKRKPPGRL